MKKLDFGPFLAPKVVRMGPDSRYDSFGLCFRPNRRFSTHFGPNWCLAPSMCLRHRELMLRQDRCLLLRLERCLLLRQDRCLLLRKGRCLLLRHY